MNGFTHLKQHKGFSTRLILLVIIVIIGVGFTWLKLAAENNVRPADFTDSPTETNNKMDNYSETPLTNRSIGYVGCSNTRDAVTGYETVSDKRFFWQPYDTSGKSIEQWADINNTAWQLFDAQVQKYGQPKAVWVQICENEKRAATYQDITRTLQTLTQRVSTKQIYISPLNSYDPANLCNRLGKDNVEDLIAFSRQAVDEGRALSGPMLGPLTPNLVKKDNCHPSSPEGDNFLGGQLVQFFDTGTIQ